MKDSPSFKKLLAVAFMVSAIGIGSGAMAGERWVYEVVANSTSISGNFADARNSEGRSQMMQITDYGDLMYLYARAYDGSWGSCVTDNSTAVAQLRAANSDATLMADISNGRCTRVIVVNASQYAPKNH